MDRRPRTTLPAEHGGASLERGSYDRGRGPRPNSPCSALSGNFSWRSSAWGGPLWPPPDAVDWFRDMQFWADGAV